MTQPTDTEAWVYVNDSHEIVISFRGTSTPADMLKDAVFDLAAFSPGDRPKSHQPEEVAEKVSDEELEEGAMGGALKFAYVGPAPMTSQCARRGLGTLVLVSWKAGCVPIMSHGPKCLAHTVCAAHRPQAAACCSCATVGAVTLRYCKHGS